MRYPILPAVVCGLALGLAGCADSTDGSLPGGRFAFRESVSGDLVRVQVSNPTGLNAAEDLLESGAARWVLGTPRRGDGGFNAPWSWHLDPASIAFAEVTIEACQTRASGVEEDLDYWIQFGQVCIWGTVEARAP